MDSFAVLEAARTAVAGARSVVVRGQVKTPGGTSRISLSLHESGATGTITSDGETVELRRVEDRLYVRGTSAATYARLLPAADRAEALGSWVQTSPEDPRLGSLGELTSMDRVVRFATGASFTTRVDEAGVAVLRNPATRAELRLSLAGPTYPIRLVRDDAEVRGTLDYSAWDAPVEVVVPDPREVVVAR